ncbi:MAG: hypothetical protein Q8P69_02010 [bacterium]|nr:hypothetical protein [bacterium]
MGISPLFFTDYSELYEPPDESRAKEFLAVILLLLFLIGCIALIKITEVYQDIKSWFKAWK